MNQDRTQIMVPLSFIGAVWIGICLNNPPGTPPHMLVRMTIESVQGLLSSLRLTQQRSANDEDTKPNPEKI